MLIQQLYSINYGVGIIETETIQFELRLYFRKSHLIDDYIRCIFGIWNSQGYLYNVHTGVFSLLNFDQLEITNERVNCSTTNPN